MARATYWVEQVDDYILARYRGMPTEELIAESHQEILSLVKLSGKNRVLYNAIEMDPPPVQVPVYQNTLDAELGAFDWRRAIVVPNSKLAYMARLAFGEGNYRVFYNDMAEAKAWLNSDLSTN